MVSVDTNILVRFLTRDDPRQAARAAALIGERQIWIAKTVLLETQWVLRALYGFTAGEILGALRLIAGSENVSLEDPVGVAHALRLYEGGLDFADALHLSSGGPHTGFATFDRRLARRARERAPVPVKSI